MKNIDNIDNVDPVISKLFDFKPRKGDLKKLAITKAFLQSVRLKGIDNTSFETLSKDLETRHSHISYYFPNKTSLLDFALFWIQTDLQSRIVIQIEKERTAMPRLKAYISGVFDCFIENPNFGPTFILALHYSTFLESYRKTYSQLRSHACQRIEAIIEDELKKYNHGPNVVQRTAKDIHTMMTGCLITFLADQQKSKTKEIKNEVSNRILRIVQALR